ncbi:hypothetical protein C463_05970 [Halorubrum californiense DSM 19288]|uniref:UbiA prenyltransferase n=1 Tax=Halorubrum californiense DSM 19288 TaxID=1227465 RepID=M0EHS2_9EURY|nr:MULTISPECIES: hypothetical protein [Halorubrum]ELZ45954.1 hypothetical protein C463_05970 [Halorubrum californiense DSM 19288]TKX72293.1 hypothetical protein EXE40_04510 [Halorubrum sp. GN11GM_10-3_MGM]
MVSRENTVVIGFVAAALLLAYGGLLLTDLSSELLIGVLIFVGTVAPMLVNNYLDRGDDAAGQ